MELPAEIDLVNAAYVEHALQQLADSGAWLLLDLSGNSFCDGSGLRAISRVQQRARQLGGWVGLVSASPAMPRLLEIFDMDRDLDCFPSREVALTELPTVSPRNVPVITLAQHPMAGKDSTPPASR